MNAIDSNVARPRDGSRKEDRHFVTALARGLDVLACFRAFDVELGNAELAQRCGLPKSTISRLTHTLTELGYLQALTDPVRYRLGSSALGMAPVAREGTDVLAVVRPYMQELADLSQGVASLIVRDRGRMLIYENCHAESYLTLRVNVGSRVSGLTTAAGRAYLMALTPAEQRQALAAFRADDRASAAQADDVLARAREEKQRLGCTTSFGEWLPDINSIALAFRPGPSLPPMTLSCSGPNAIVPPAHLLDAVRPQLHDRIGRIEAALGTR
ncbi:IclR family transcriptional regulator [Cupriavidus plantarum]|uniref:IclR family transcriptional regulator n=1 Tax=Cupriavidus plantarum TaxID=942865 RepID=UPI000E251827|nr:IclR family transcriptional regulator [Cupriavidus plantarum]NYI00615.1 DNA-binding IclR family transcriptional regulator [Cupriavidus plantarum]REE93469.1 IclR family transcriptional regulator [Cupriavidus plantarum]RLK38898.1 IclR family transcriptional regulator [Cupriavidus plantarum]